MNLEQWANEVLRIYQIVEPSSGVPSIRLVYQAKVDNKAFLWRAECGGVSPEVGMTPNEAAARMLASLRKMLKHHIDTQRQVLESLQTLENEAAIKMLETSVDTNLT